MKKPDLTALGESTPEAYYRALQRDVLARTLWGEARGEGAQGLRAVACVILNRASHAREKGGFWWGNDVIQICQKPYQFSCWNRGDPNYRKLLAVTAQDKSFAAALDIADKALAGCLRDETGGATHYHASSMLPYWAKFETPTARIGRHVFYRLP